MNHFIHLFAGSKCTSGAQIVKSITSIPRNWMCGWTRPPSRTHKYTREDRQDSVAPTRPPRLQLIPLAYSSPHLLIFKSWQQIKYL